MAPGRRAWRVALEAGAIATFALLLYGLLLRLAPLGQAPGGAWLFLTGAAVGLLAADAAGGLAHWFCDRFLEEDTWVLGPLLIAPFREHHLDPQAMTRHGFLELNGNSALALAPVLALALWCWPSGEASSGALFFGSFLVVFTIAAFATNQLHCWAHRLDPPAAVRWLQRRGLVLSPEAHARHHAPPHDRAYCVTTGWLNRGLDRCGFFRASERVLRRLGVPSESAAGWSSVIGRRPRGAGRAS